LTEVKLLSFDPGDSIEAHNPPEMTGVMACIAGKVAVETYDSIYVDSALRTATLRKRGTATLRERDTSTLTIGRGNIHQLVSKEGCEIIDIFTPPYSSNRVHATNWYDISNVPIANTPNLYEAHISHV